MLHPINDPDDLDSSGLYNGTTSNITYNSTFTDGSSPTVFRAEVTSFEHLNHSGNVVRSFMYRDENQKTYIARDNKWVEFANKVFGDNDMYYGDDYDSGVDDVHYDYKQATKIHDEEYTSTQSKKTIKTEVNIMNQFMTLDIGSNKATLDLSKVRKQGLVFEKTMFGRKPKIVIYYIDRPDVPEVNFELNSEDEAQSVYKKINTQLEKWAEESNSAKITRLERELEVMREQKTAILEEKEVLMSVFNSFKEMMQIMEDDTKTSTLLSKIEAM